MIKTIGFQKPSQTFEVHSSQTEATLQALKFGHALPYTYAIQEKKPKFLVKLHNTQCIQFILNCNFFLRRSHPRIKTVGFPA